MNFNKNEKEEMDRGDAVGWGGVGWGGVVSECRKAVEVALILRAQAEGLHLFLAGKGKP